MRIRVLIACAPKSGSTYTARVLSEYLEAERVYPQEYAGYREQNILPEYFKDTLDKSIVTQLHVLPHEPNIKSILALDLKVIWLRRNLADSLLSLDAHIKNEDHRNPACFVLDRKDYISMRFERRINYLIRYALPWYLAFYFSWKKTDIVNCGALYENLIADKYIFFERILKALDAPIIEEKLVNVLSKKYENVRFNKGIYGLSATAFSFENKNMLEDMLYCHPEDTSELLAELPWNAGSVIC